MEARVLSSNQLLLSFILCAMEQSLKQSEQPLIDADALQQRIQQLACDIQPQLASKDVLAIAVMSGSMFFAADLLRKFSTPMRLCSVWARSYNGCTTTSSGEVVLSGMDEALSLARGRDVLLIDDILDSGRTISRLHQALHMAKVRSLCTTVLLSKRIKRACEVQVDHVGFEIDNHFVIGYGLDHDGYYRNLPAIYTLS